MGLLLLAAQIGGVFWEAYVLQVLWGWFIVPVFGLVALTLPHAIGLATISGLLTYQRPRTQEDDEDAAARSIGWCLLFPAMSLLVGWLAK